MKLLMAEVRAFIVIHNAVCEYTHKIYPLAAHRHPIYSCIPPFWALILLFCIGSVDLHAKTLLLEVRLQTKISSKASKTGDPVRAVVIAPLEKDGEIIIPSHTLVTGKITKVRGVGLGLRRERAILELKFFRLEFPDGSTHSVDLNVVSVQNAREAVMEDGKIRGILATGGAPGFLTGMWSLPDPEMLARSSVGFSGVSYFASQSFGLHPASSAGIVALRMLLVPFPEPEIRYSRQTEMLLSASEMPDLHGRPVTPKEVPDSIALLVSGQPWLTNFAVTGESADVTNFLFIGSAEELENAFETAGWYPTDPLTSRSALRVYGAMTRQTGYATAPVSTILLEGVPPAYVFQKSLNTIAKRHHIRIWKRPDKYHGKDVWLGAATHDIGIKMGKTLTSFTHKIDPVIDTERQKIITDLSFAGCVKSTHLVDRQLNSIPKQFTTDGRIAAVSLHPCEEEAEVHEEMRSESSGMYKFARRIILECRHSILRGNVYYWSYRGIRKGFFSPKPPNVTTE